MKNMTSLEIRKVLGLSTAHISVETRMCLKRTAHMAEIGDNEADDEDDVIGLTVYDFCYGFFVFTGGLKIIGGKICNTYNNNAPCSPMPRDLADCISLALENDCQWIQFDGDAGEVEQLPVYED